MNAKPIHLFQDYYIKEVSLATLDAFQMENFISVFPNQSYFRPESVLNEEELVRFNELKENFRSNDYRLNLLYYCKDEVIGWHRGYQENVDTFYMQNTGILPAHQNKGVYSKSLPFILNLLKKAGMQRVTSKHIVSNNPVIVSKLKAGFCISGFEISDKYGMMLNMVYLFNPKRKEVFDYRTGVDLKSPELKEYFFKNQIT